MEETRSRTRGVRGLGLHLKLVLAGTVTTFVGIALVTTFIVFQQANVLHEEIGRSTEALRFGLIERGRLLAESMASSMENAIAGYNFTFVASSVKALQKRNSNLRYAFITNARDTVIIHTDPEQLGKKHEFLPDAAASEFSSLPDGSNIVEIYQPITVGGSRWGTLVLAFDLRTIESRATLAMLRGKQIMVRSTTFAVTAGALVTILGIILSVLLSRRLLQPVTLLAADAAAIAQGNLDGEIRVTASGDEIGFLARQFELMRKSIKTYIGELLVAKQKAEAATREEKRLRGQIEEHSKLLEIKVEERTSELRQINARLTEYDRMKSEFLSNVSHELRSPLAAISSAAKIISRYGDENKRTGRKFSSVITDEADRLGRLINDLLDLAKIEAGRVEWNIERLDNPIELLDHVVATFRPLADERKVDLRLECATALPPLDVDEDRIIQVLTNLCSNAMKFTPEGGSIVVSGELTSGSDGPCVRVCVQDTGPGIPPEELEKVFDRFHQVKAKKDGNKPKGTGLGLAICREVVNHHGGEIWAEAPPEGGARMVFFLPVADARDRMTTGGAEPSPPPA